jgi:hypothetical protein
MEGQAVGKDSDTRLNKSGAVPKFREIPFAAYQNAPGVVC